MERFSSRTTPDPRFATGSPTATSVSGRDPRALAVGRLAGVLARTVLVPGVLAMVTTGCLITSTPQFTAPEHTAPFLLAATALPDPYQVVIVDDANLPPAGFITFSADVISQDDPAGSSGLFQSVSAYLYIDYGVSPEPGVPFAYDLQGNAIAAGTLDQTPTRQLSASWYPVQYSVPAGCHTATLVASHHFDMPLGCPSCQDDYSMITWQVLRCNSTLSDDCRSFPVMGSAGCLTVTTSCAAVQAASGMSSCPEVTDGGSP